MKHFNIITIFPHIFESYFGESIIKRALDKKIIDINVVNLRDFTNDKHNTVDDTPFGGGAGMVLKVEPIYRAVQNVLDVENVEINNCDKRSDLTTITPRTTRTILFSAKGKRYTQSDAVRLSKYDNLIFICGRYEGVDERVAQNIADEEISIGDYVLTGGEIPAMILVDSISRLIPEVLGNEESLKEESHNMISDTEYQMSNTSLEYPQYTRPEIFSAKGGDWKVPEILLSGNHGEIDKWRKENAKPNSASKFT
jgi:tRNA (guanine37-N1)-methyltransferase